MPILVSFTLNTILVMNLASYFRVKVENMLLLAAIIRPQYRNNFCTIRLVLLIFQFLTNKQFDEISGNNETKTKTTSMILCTWKIDANCAALKRQQFDSISTNLIKIHHGWNNIYREKVHLFYSSIVDLIVGNCSMAFIDVVYYNFDLDIAYYLLRRCELEV